VQSPQPSVLLAVQRNEIPSDQHLVIRLEDDAIDDRRADPTQRNRRQEIRVETAIYIEPCQACTGHPVHQRELATDEDFAITLQRRSVDGTIDGRVETVGGLCADT